MQKKRPEGRFFWLITNKSVSVVGARLCKIDPSEGTQTCPIRLRLGELWISFNTNVCHV